MITNLVAMAVHDVVKITDGGSFFEETDAARGARVDRTFGKSYPAPLRAYIASVSAKQFAEDIEVLLPLLATGSVMAYGRSAHTHAFLRACVESIKIVWTAEQIEGNSAFEAAVNEMLSERETSRAGRVMTREAQQFIELVLREDSPQIQMADDPGEQSSRYAHFQSLYNGLPSFLVNRRLLGGSRLFVKGTLVDNSWRAKVEHYLSALR